MIPDIADPSAVSHSGVPYICYSCLESAAEQLVLGLGCGKRGIWLGRMDWTKEMSEVESWETCQDEHT